MHFPRTRNQLDPVTSSRKIYFWFAHELPISWRVITYNISTSVRSFVELGCSSRKLEAETGDIIFLLAWYTYVSTALQNSFCVQNVGKLQPRRFPDLQRNISLRSFVSGWKHEIYLPFFANQLFSGAKGLFSLESPSSVVFPFLSPPTFYSPSKLSEMSKKVNRKIRQCWPSSGSKLCF